MLEGQGSFNQKSQTNLDLVAADENRSRIYWKIKVDRNTLWKFKGNDYALLISNNKANIISSTSQTQNLQNRNKGTHKAQPNTRRTYQQYILDSHSYQLMGQCESGKTKYDITIKKIFKSITWNMSGSRWITRMRYTWK